MSIFKERRTKGFNALDYAIIHGNYKSAYFLYG